MTHSDEPCSVITTVPAPCSVLLWALAREEGRRDAGWLPESLESYIPAPGEVLSPEKRRTGPTYFRTLSVMLDDRPARHRGSEGRALLPGAQVREKAMRPRGLQPWSVGMHSCLEQTQPRKATLAKGRQLGMSPTDQSNFSYNSYI